MVPQLEEVRPDVGQRAAVVLHDVQVLLGQLPHGRAAALKQGGVVQVALCGVSGGGGLKAAGAHVPGGTAPPTVSSQGQPLARVLRPIRQTRRVSEASTGPGASRRGPAPLMSTSRGPASPALMTPWTPVSWMQRSTSRRLWMFPLANTGMATACLPGAGSRHSGERDPVPSLLRTVLHPPHSARAGASRSLPARAAAPPAMPTHRTALICSQDAVPDKGPFCSLVRPCTVSN